MADENRASSRDVMELSLDRTDGGTGDWFDWEVAFRRDANERNREWEDELS